MESSSSIHDFIAPWQTRRATADPASASESSLHERILSAASSASSLRSSEPASFKEAPQQLFKRINSFDSSYLLSSSANQELSSLHRGAFVNLSNFSKGVKKQVLQLLKQEDSSWLAKKNARKELRKGLSPEDRPFLKYVQEMDRVLHRLEMVRSFLKNYPKTSTFIDEALRYIQWFLKPEDKDSDKRILTLFLAVFDAFMNDKNITKKTMSLCLTILGGDGTKSAAEKKIQSLRDWNDLLLRGEKESFEGFDLPERAWVEHDKEIEEKFYRDLRGKLKRCIVQAPTAELIKQQAQQLITSTIHSFFKEIYDPNRLTLSELLGLASPRASYVIQELHKGALLYHIQERISVAQRYAFSYLCFKSQSTSRIRIFMNHLREFIETYTSPDALNRFLSFYEGLTEENHKKTMESILGGSRDTSLEVLEELRKFARMEPRDVIPELMRESLYTVAASLVRNRKNDWKETSSQAPDEISVESIHAGYFTVDDPSRNLYSSLKVNGVSVPLTGYQGTGNEVQIQFFTCLFQTFLYEGSAPYEAYRFKTLAVLWVNQPSTAQDPLIKDLMVASSDAFWQFNGFFENYPSLNLFDCKMLPEKSCEWTLDAPRFTCKQTRWLGIFGREGQLLSRIKIEWEGRKDKIWQATLRIADISFMDAEESELILILEALHASERVRGDRFAENPLTWPSSLHSQLLKETPPNLIDLNYDRYLQELRE